jgi:hypothetical protein
MDIIEKWAAVNKIAVQRIEPTDGMTILSALPQKMKGAMDSVKTVMQTGHLRSPTKTNRSIVIDKNNGIITLHVNHADLKHINALCIVAKESKVSSMTGTKVITSGAQQSADANAASSSSPPPSPTSSKYDFFGRKSTKSTKK